MRKTTESLTEGNITRQIIRFTIPIFLGYLFQNMYHSVDSIVMGNFCGTVALAAVSASEDISQLLVSFFTGLSTGFGVLLARYFGAKDDESLHTAIHTAVLFSAILGLIMAGAGILLTPVLLQLIDCPPDVMGQATLYLRIYMVGVLFTSMYNVACSVWRAVGNSRQPFYYLAVASVCNVVLDLLFVAGFHMGVEGVAIATIISQFLSCVLSYRKLFREEGGYRLVLRDLRIDREMLRQVMWLGFPTAVQNCMIAFSNMFVQRYINGFGSAAMAGIGAAKKIDKYEGMIALSLGLAMSNFVSQNIGAKRYDRALQGLRAALLMGFVTVACLGTLIYFFSDFFVGLFIKDPVSIDYGSRMVRVMMPMFYSQSLHQIFSNTVRGFGRSTQVMITTVLGLIIIRQLFLAVTMSLNPVVENVFWAYPVGWCASAFLSIGYFLLAVYRPIRNNGLLRRDLTRV